MFMPDKRILITLSEDQYQAVKAKAERRHLKPTRWATVVVVAGAQEDSKSTSGIEAKVFDAQPKVTSDPDGSSAAATREMVRDGIKRGRDGLTPEDFLCRHPMSQRRAKLCKECGELVG